MNTHSFSTDLAKKIGLNEAIIPLVILTNALVVMTNCQLRSTLSLDS